MEFLEAIWTGITRNFTNSKEHVPITLIVFVFGFPIFYSKSKKKK